MKRIAFVAGVAAGYVLGTRAGQKRYEQIRSRAQQVWSSEPVQQKVEVAKQTIADKAPVVAEKVGAATRAASSGIKDRVRGGEDLPETLHRGRDGHLHADNRGFGPGGDKLP